MTKRPRLTALKPRVGTLPLRVKPPPHTVLPFYVSPEWRALMARLIAQRGRRCEKCGTTGCKIYGDHIIELKDGGAALDPAGIQLLCAGCHNRKTSDERDKRMARRG